MFGFYRFRGSKLKNNGLLFCWIKLQVMDSEIFKRKMKVIPTCGCRDRLEVRCMIARRLKI